MVHAIQEEEEEEEEVHLDCHTLYCLSALLCSVTAMVIAVHRSDLVIGQA